MPNLFETKPVRKQADTTMDWQRLYEAMPEEDPLREKVNKACRAGGSTDKEKHELLEEIEAQDQAKPKNGAVDTVVKLLKAKEAVIKDCVNLEEKNRRWAAEWNKLTPDPQKLREIRDGYMKDIDSLEGHISQLEGKLAFEEGHKETFIKNSERQLASADLRVIEKTTKSGQETMKLGEMVRDMVNGNSWAAFMEESENKKKKKMGEIAYAYAVYVVKLKELQTEAKLHPKDLFAKRVEETVEKHLASPELLRHLSEMENKAVEKQIEQVKLEAEDQKLKDYRTELEIISKAKRPLTVSEGEFFEQQKKAVLDKLAKIIAVQTAARTIKSMKVSLQEMQDRGQGQSMSEEELNTEIKGLLSDDYLNKTAAFIKTRDDFDAIAKSITTKELLDDIVRKAQTGNALLDELHKAGKGLIHKGVQNEKDGKPVEKSGPELNVQKH